MFRFCHPNVEILEARLVLTTYTVIKTSDAGPGSFRQAILDANADPGNDSILFNIPGDGVHTIEPLSPLPRIVGPLTIDGTGQPGYAGQPLIELNGSFAGANANGLENGYDICTIEGLDINSFSGYGIFLSESAGSNPIVQDNCLGTDPTGTIAEGNGNGIYIGELGTLVSHNLISGNRGTGIITSGGLCTVVNNLIGTDATGTVAVGNGSDGIFVAGGSMTSGNVISGNGGNGIFSEDHGSATIQNNLVGTDATGTHPLGNHLEGMLLGQGVLNVVNFTISGNTVAANGGDGITFDGDRSRFQSNQIGVGLDGSSLGNGGNGVTLNSIFSSNNSIYSNTIAYNNGDGVLVNQGHSDAIRANSIFGNGNLGIELLNANNNQAAPVLDSAIAYAHRIIVSGTITSAPNADFTIDLFVSSSAGPQGERYLTSINVATDANGFAAFRTRIYGSFVGEWVTATATDSAGDSSEFSVPVEADAQWTFLGVCLDARQRKVAGPQLNEV